MLYEAAEWFVVRTKPKREGYAQEQLSRRGVDTFLPRILEPGRTTSEPIIGPLFPGYLFANISLATQYTRVIWAPGVRSLVAFGDVPSPVDSDVIHFLQERCGEEGIVRAIPSFEDGDAVRVKSGPLAGLVGVVQGQVSGRCRVRVLMELLRRRTHVTVPIQMLEHASI